MISISRSMATAQWARSLEREVRTPVFPRIPAPWRPYLLAVALFAFANAAMYAGDAALLRFGLPWPLVSILIVAVAAGLWGIRAALLVLGLSLAYGAIVVPQLAAPAGTPPFWEVLLVRSALFGGCGAATIFLTFRAQQMQRRAEIQREVVRALQSMTLPNALPDAPGYDISGVYRPAHQEEEVGGDLYDFFPIGPGRFGILIGDVMGKGKEAAASTSLLRYSVRALLGTGIRPAGVMRRLDQLIDQQEPRFHMASLFVGILDARTGALNYANAGHQPPLLRRTSGEHLELDTTGPVLGTRLDIPFEESDIALGIGDALLLMTDGVTEARNTRQQLLGAEGATRLLEAALRQPTTREALATIDSGVATHIGAADRGDIAMLLLRRR